jgi:hypothetical protein
MIDSNHVKVDPHAVGAKGGQHKNIPIQIQELGLEVPIAQK